MAASDGLARLVAPDSPWVESTRAFLGPLKTGIIYSHPSVTAFFRQWDSMTNGLLSFFSPDLPLHARQTVGLPLMDGKDVLLAILGYLLVVGLSLMMLKGSFKNLTQAKKQEEKSVLAKMGPVFVFQALYNIAQVVVCGFVVFRVLDVLRTEHYSILCNSFNVANTRMGEVTWLFYILKYVDLLDTAFMIMRGNWRQVSFLHVYHHSSVIYIMWVNASVGYDGDVYYVVLLNSFVHVVMYAYYFMASFNMPLARVIKSCVTKLQMIQFIAMIIHAFYHIYRRDSCSYPVRITVNYLTYVVSLFLLFRNFSQKTYHPTGNQQRLKVKAT